MYFDSAVAIPSIKGKIITKKKGGASYILFEYGRKYNPEKRYSVPQRVIISKVTEDNPGRMLLYSGRKISSKSEKRYVY